MKKICKCGKELSSLTGRKIYCHECRQELNRIKQSEHRRKLKICSDCLNCTRFDCILKIETDYEWKSWMKEVEYA
jgi:hypothetical protein